MNRHLTYAEQRRERRTYTIWLAVLIMTAFTAWGFAPEIDRWGEPTPREAAAAQTDADRHLATLEQARCE